MHREIDQIAAQLEEVYQGRPWYGKAVIKILDGVDPSRVYEKPAEGSHTQIELLYHMLTWEEYTLHHLKMEHERESPAYELLDWRETDPLVHTWNTGVAGLTASHNRIISLLKASGDDLLEKEVRPKKLNVRKLLLGLMQHNIYHAAQIAYLSKLLAAKPR